jgi:hypothetical protein
MEKELEKIRKTKKKLWEIDAAQGTILKGLVRGGLNEKHIFEYQKLVAQKNEHEAELRNMKSEVKARDTISDAALEILTHRTRYNLAERDLKHLHNIDSVSAEKAAKLAKKYPWLVDAKNKDLKVQRVKELLKAYHGLV